MDSFDPFQHFGFLTNRIGRLIGVHTDRIIKEMGYNMPCSCIGILADLWNGDGINQKDLGLSLIKTKSSITKMLEALEQEELILKKNDPADKRNKLIYLTVKGQQFQSKMEKMAKKMEEKLLQEVPLEEIEITKKVLKTLYLNLSDNSLNLNTND